MSEKTSFTFAASAFWKECKPVQYNPNNEQGLSVEELKKQNAHFCAGQLEVYRTQNDFNPVLSPEQQKSVDIVNSVHSSYNDPDLVKAAEMLKEQELESQTQYTAPAPSMS